MWYFGFQSIRVQIWAPKVWLKFYEKVTQFYGGTLLNNAENFWVLYSRFEPKIAMEAKKLKFITTLPLRLAQKEPKKARKCQTLIFKLEGWYFACRVIFSQYEDPRTQFLDFSPKRTQKRGLTPHWEAQNSKIELCSILQAVFVFCSPDFSQKLWRKPKN